MLITKDEIQAMTIAEKNELLDMLWESLERENYIDDVQKKQKKKSKFFLKD